MKRILLVILFTCVYAKAYTQVNYVKNPSFEDYSKCPDDWNQIYLAKNWRNASDSSMSFGMEYYNACSNSSGDNALYIPNNGGFWQNAHLGNGIGGAVFYYDKTSPAPPSPLPFNYRDNLQGHLVKPLIVGKTYCVSFWVNSAEASGYVHNKIGAYLDNGAINSIADTAGEEITSVTPQVFTNTIVEDTMNWVKIEGSFIATGIETYISIGNFFPNSSVATKYTNYWNVYKQYSYYLIDDVSVVPIDAQANAGLDRWVELGSTIAIGPVADSTARAMDCKWYHKGALIDSGNVITVNASAIKYAVDTYVVVQNVCGNITRDTMLLRTVGLGIGEHSLGKDFSIYPNPGSGTLVIASAAKQSEPRSYEAKIYDLLGRVVHQQQLHFANKEASLKLNVPSGTYILELQDEAGHVQRERIVIQ